MCEKLPAYWRGLLVEATWREPVIWPCARSPCSNDGNARAGKSAFHGSGSLSVLTAPQLLGRSGRGYARSSLYGLRRYAIWWMRATGTTSIIHNECKVVHVQCSERATPLRGEGAKPRASLLRGSRVSEEPSG